jgi:hypothetical protein
MSHVASRPRRRRDQRGFALPAVFLALLTLFMLGTSGVVYSTLDLRATSHYDTGNRAFFAAEAGLMRALNTMNEIGVINFQQDMVAKWGQRYGAALKTMPSDPQTSYEITVAADAANPANRGTITSTGRAALGGRRSLIVTVAKSNVSGSPGAIYLAADNVTSQFTGNAFAVDGNDHDMDGDLVPGGPVKPGISTRNETVSNGVTNSLNNIQKDNVQGLGFSTNPLTPSVLPTGGPDINDLDAIVNHLMSLPGVVTTSQTNFNGNDVFGTVAAPRVTRMTASDVKLNGNASGAGVLIVDGSLTISGTLDFIGWIIVRGDTIINAVGDSGDDTTLIGNATIYGSLWTGHLNIKVGGSAIAYYCNECMNLVDTMAAGSNVVPRPMRVVSWQEVM